MKKFFKKNKEIIIVVFLFFLSLFFRVYQLPKYISFHQDQVRDLFYIKKYFEQKKIILLGPKASVGDFYLPPFWYYLMSFVYLFSKSPLAQAFMVAFLNSIATIFIYLLTKKIISYKISFLISLLYSLSPLSIEYSRFAWNPNPIPLFTILTFYFLILFLEKRKEVFFILSTIFANLTFQLHYQGLIVFVFYFLTILLTKNFNFKRFLKYFLINFILFFPFFVFEIKNNFSNTLGIINFVLRTQSVNKLKFFGIPFFIKFIIKDLSGFLAKTIFFKNQILGYFGLIFLFFSLIFFIFRFSKLQKIYQLIISFLIFSLIMLYIYKNSLIDFYLLFLIPFLIIYFSLTINYFLTKKTTKIILIILIIMNFLKSPIFGNYDKTYLWLEKTTKIISENKKPYCVIYNIFPQNFIEEKLRYLMTLQKNQPLSKNCDFKNNQKIKTIFYICERPLCPQTKFDLKQGKIINLDKLNSDIKIYRFDF